MDEDTLDYTDDGLIDISSDEEPANWDGEEIPYEVYRQAAIDDALRTLDVPF